MKLTSVENFRDLSECLPIGGHKIRKGLLYRSALWTDSCEEDRKLLRSMGVSKLIDLRSTFERSRYPEAIIEGIEPVHIEIITLNGNMFKQMAHLPIVEFLKSPGATMLCDGFYLSFVDNDECIGSFRTFMREVIEADGKPILWHCTQGKDRTGLCAAFLLFCLGADRKVVLDDFNKSTLAFTDLIREMKEKVIASGGDEKALENTMTLFGVNEGLFIDALDYIDANYGGMEAFIRNQLMVTDEELQRLKDIYLD